MLNLDPSKLAGATIPVATGWLLGECMEARGKQDLWLRRKPEILAALREQAIIQSVESSNRIEGVTVAANRLRPLALGTSRPRDRSEEELAGYRTALDWILSRRRPVSFAPSVFLKLRAFAQGGFSGDAGEWKKRDNEIVEVLPNGERRIRFVPVSAKATPGQMERLCANWNATVGEDRVPPLLSAATFVFDFLCIHSFRDGNGRVSRLATTLLLESLGFKVARYISMERLVEQSKEEYYGVLGACSKGWHEGKNDIVPWWNHFLGILRRAYRELEEKVELGEGRPAKSDLVRAAILEQVEHFALADLSAQFPSASPQLVKKVLAELKAEGMVSLSGRGQDARWKVVH